MAAAARLTVLATLLLALFGGIIAWRPAEAANLEAPEARVQVIRHVPADEGGTGVNNFIMSDWFVFSVLLGPFLVLVTGLVVMTLFWDRFTGENG